MRILHTLSFVEDPTRILRAVRFAHRYGFRLERETEACARRAIAEGFLGRVSRERLRNELLLLLQEPACGGALQMLADLGGLEDLLPGVGLTPEVLSLLDAADGLPEAEPEISAGSRLWLVKLLVLLHPLPLNQGAALVKRLRLKRAESQACLQVLRAGDRPRPGDGPPAGPRGDRGAARGLAAGGAAAPAPAGRRRPGRGLL
ncbi:MAG: hypothetical protein A6D92_07385 [Symbiobacterium thermophilum]|uniref:tRNA nucleotidyltransferase/poly(A) polymerase RNA and SrmB- binding domain-containing protein n=1 Tax=Symbiobacterium thermophilum TaxID=2734 RepID=A0A1Y2T4F2_SYMTR|nr:MAG: hypothetical protein A6D92_07385 [Symbiobacterium thermophilum]